MSLSLLIYLGSLASGVSGFFLGCSIILGFLVLAIVASSYVAQDEDVRDGCAKVRNIFILLFIISSLITIFLPSKKAINNIISVQYLEDKDADKFNKLNELFNKDSD